MSDLILLVEDNEKNMKLARDLLQYHGFTTVEATNAEDGIVLAKERSPKLVLMDIQLPGMDGVAALEHLRGDPNTSRIPIVAMTASVMKEDRERFDKAGFDGFITKPIDVRAFPQQVRDAIAKGRA
ncbi:MAG: response regulator [Chloroflexi bacterium]|nr:MAG: response regulator [Chloroflexota bacterium]TMB96462.1 MAG: response regulator [Chloroflexota bacterium]TMC28278.1 MAG: response regulator [Chloroflexota bacterium]TMC31791.1 MAG: response regulator [Chloroflexota bacterium]TME37012.1 MAG: response regulator [Chloroflexota bacterium]